MKKLDITGMRFGRLVAVRETGQRKPGAGTIWRCLCDCGSLACIGVHPLRSGNTRSCGCLKRDATSARARVHGMSSSAEHAIWRVMKDRCLNARNARFESYGGRGITVCKRWRDSFQNFFNDMGPRPKGKSLDRINNDGNYEPGNCRWATATQQNQNRRKPTRRRYVETDGL